MYVISKHRLINIYWLHNESSKVSYFQPFNCKVKQRKSIVQRTLTDNVFLHLVLIIPWKK